MILPPRSSSKRFRRRGSIYTVTLLTGLLVSTIGLAALQLQRAQGQSASELGDFAEARILARTAIEIGMLQIRNDPYWRTNLGNGTWISERPIGQGRFSLAASDPIDRDVTKGENHPVILVGTGRRGAATFSTSVRMEVGPRVGSCLEVPMISGRNTTVSGAALQSDSTVSSNGSYSAGSGAVINANVEAVGGISGSTYTGTKTPKLSPRDMPVAAKALEYYLSSGTAISYTDLNLVSQSELLTNTRFETDVSGWYASGGTSVLQISSAQAKEGTYSMLVKSRATANAVACQDVPPHWLTSGNKYQLWLPIFPAAACTAQAALTLTSTGSGVQTYTTPPVLLQKNASGVFTWTDLKGEIRPTWEGTLTKASVGIIISVKNNYYLDKVSLLDVTFPKGAYVMDRQVLSPASNPFGNRQTNAQGIYILNGGGKRIIVGRMRIVGTLVVSNRGGSFEVFGPVCWEPAVYNFPALLSSETLKMNLDATPLGEADTEVNLNPPGVPYPYLGGGSNDTLSDAYPNRITGLLYTQKDLELNGANAFSGIVIAGNDLKVSGTSCTMNYSNLYLNDPPPGFDVGTIKMQVVSGTWKRHVE